MKLCRALKLLLPPSARIFEDDIIFQLKNIIFGLVNKAKDHIERDHQSGMIISKMYAGVTDFCQSQTLQV